MPNGNLYKHERYREIVEEQIALGYASPSLSFDVTDDMCPYDRKLTFNSIQKIREAELEAKEKAMGNKKPKKK